MKDAPRRRGTRGRSAIAANERAYYDRIARHPAFERRYAALQRRIVERARLWAKLEKAKAAGDILGAAVALEALIELEGPLWPPMADGT